MKNESLRPWVDALRSGKYKQGKGLLKSNDGKYCCLGVYCEVNGLVIDSNRGNDVMINSIPRGYEPLEEVLESDIVNRLWNMNDTYNKSFSEIADWIEENL